MLCNYSGQKAPALSKKLHSCNATQIGDNEVVMANKHCPTDSFKDERSTAPRILKNTLPIPLVTMQRCNGATVCSIGRIKIQSSWLKSIIP